MSQPLQEELSLRAVGLSYPDPDAFVQSQWRWPRWVYLVWRGMWLMWHVAITVASAVNYWDKTADSTDGGSKWFIYYPHLTFIVTILACICDFVGSVRASPRPTNGSSTAKGVLGTTALNSADKEEILFHGEFTVLHGLKEKPTPRLSQLTWLLYSVINSSNILASAWFFAVTHDDHTYAVETVAHVTNSVFVVSNVLVSASPVRLLHLVYPVLYTGAYVLFTAVYRLAGGRGDGSTSSSSSSSAVYTQLDWDDAYPTALTVTLGLLVVLPLIHGVVFALFTFRLYLHARLNSASYHPGSRSDGGVTGVRYFDRTASGGQEATANIEGVGGDRGGTGS